MNILHVIYVNLLNVKLWGKKHLHYNNQVKCTMKQKVEFSFQGLEKVSKNFEKKIRKRYKFETNANICNAII